jgi:chain length determinant protein tyrosine kinase EpsG
MNSQILPLHRAHHDGNAEGPPENKLLIGALLVEAGRLSPADASNILDFQKKSGLLYGEAGIAMGLLTEHDVAHALAVQFGQANPSSDHTFSRDLIAALEPDSAAVEHLRQLRSQLTLRWFENDVRQSALAIVSPGKGDGRSYIAANLAVLFSQLGKRTLLIDADLRRPRQHDIFGVPGRIGLSAVLAGRAGPEVIGKLPGLPDLAVMPAGAIPPNPQELLAREGFVRLLTTMRSTYEVILVDTPATSTCADASTIAARTGAALMVACRDRSRVDRVARLTAELRQFGVTVVGAVLNGAGKA